MSDDPNFVPANLVSAGRVIAPRLPNLEPDQFWFVMRAAGYEIDLLAWVAAMNDFYSPSYDLISWAGITSKLQFAKYFEREHPLIEDARLALQISGEEMDALWIYGAT